MTLSNLFRVLQGSLYAVLSTSHNWMFGGRDEIPALAADTNPEAQRRENLEEQSRIELHLAILYVVFRARVALCKLSLSRTPFFESRSTFQLEYPPLQFVDDLHHCLNGRAVALRKEQC